MTKKPVVFPPTSSERKTLPANPSVSIQGVFRLGSIMGIPIYAHVLTILLLAIVSLAASTFGDPSLALFILGAATSLLFHEVGHALVARRYGYDVQGVIAYPFQSVAIINGTINPSHEIQIVLGGPVVNASIALLLLVYLSLQKGFLLHSGLLPVGMKAGVTCLFFVNAVIAIGNLLPALPLDGGQCLRAFLQGSMGRSQAVQAVTRTSIFLCLCLPILGIFLQLPLLGIFALLIFIGTLKELRLEAGRVVISGVVVKEAMFRDFKTVSTGDRIGAVSKLMISSQQSCFPVVCGEQVVGILSATAIHHTLSRNGESAYVSEGMNKQFQSISSEDSLEAGILRLQANQRVPILVMDDEELVGMLTEDSIRRCLEVRSLSSLPK